MRDLDPIFNEAEDLETSDAGCYVIPPGVLLIFEGFTDVCLAFMDAHGKTWEQQNDELDRDFDEKAEAEGYTRALTELTWNGSGEVAFKAYEKA